MVSTCCGPYPYENLDKSIFTNGDSAHTEIMSEYGFYYDSSGGGVCGDTGCYLPKVNVSFLGNVAACEDNDFVRREILELNELSTISWWDIWVSSGVIASILLSAAFARFGVSLAKLADPLMSCDGKYIGPPSNLRLSEPDLNSLMKEKREGLKLAAMGSVTFWGIVTNLLMLNIVVAMGNNDSGDDVGPLVTLMVFSFIIAAGSSFLFIMGGFSSMLRFFRR